MTINCTHMHMHANINVHFVTFSKHFGIPLSAVYKNSVTLDQCYFGSVIFMFSCVHVCVCACQYVNQAVKTQ